MTEPSFACLYCGYDKPKSEESLEHAIPQFMGGEFAPQRYMLRNVCVKCNNLLGLFVDASYAKSWFVTNCLSIAAHRLFTDSSDDLPLPLVCMGLSKIPGLVIEKGQVVEHWIGPSGETIIWIRSSDERLHGYSGGNPIDKKKKPSTAYLCPTSNDPARLRIGIESFLHMFKHIRIRKILCAEVLGPTDEAPLSAFNSRTFEDQTNVDAVMKALNSGHLGCQIGFHVRFDQRFLAKIALGIGYSLFGQPYLNTNMARDARDICWPKDGVNIQSRGSTTFGTTKDPLLSKFIGYPGAVVLTVMNTGHFYVLSVVIDQTIPIIVELAPSHLVSDFVSRDEGYALLLFPSLGRSIELTLAELIAHSTDVQKHTKLEYIDARFKKSFEFWSQLGPI